MLSESENDTFTGLVLARAYEGMFSGGSINAMGFSGETIEQTCRVAARNMAQRISNTGRSLTAELVFRNDEEFDIEDYAWVGMLGLNRSRGYYG